MGRIVTITRTKPGRTNASSVPIKLSPTTRHEELRGNRALEVGGKKPAHRFDAADLATLAPSFTAMELAEYLHKPDAFLADFRDACHSPKKHELIDDERAKVAEFKKSRDHSPSEREDIIKAFWDRSRANRKAVLRECRVNAKRWIALVRMYEIDRAWLLGLPRIVRIKLINQLAEGVRRAASNEIPAFDREEGRRRAANCKETRKDAKRNRKSSGHRKARPMIPMTPEGQIDCRALAERELLWLKASGVNTGISIGQGQDQWGVTEELRIAKRLTDEAHKFMNWKKDRSV